MAHRHERRPVRDRGHGAHRRARALSGAAALALALIAAVAPAQDWVPRGSLIDSALPDPASWWAEYGRPGWVADQWLNVESPWTMAGHARGGVRLDEPGRPDRTIIDPAAAGSFTPLVWYDSLRVVEGAGGAWQGFDGALATIEGITTRFGHRGAEGVIDLRSGDFSWDENSLSIARHDSLEWMRGEAYGLNRGAAGAYEPSGRHLWGLGGGVRRGAHELEGSFTQEGVGARLFGTEEESGWTRSGGATYRYTADAFRGEVAFARGISHTESFAELFDLSKRDANASQLTARAWHASGLTAGVQLRQSRMSRTESDAFEARERLAWGTAGWSGDVSGGRLTADLGAGVHSGLHRHVDVAPDVSYEITGLGYRARVGAERGVHAVWSDLAAGQEPFLQSTWAGVVDLGLGTTAARRLHLTFLSGRTRARAIVTRTPLSEVALRTGIFADPELYTFALVNGDAEGSWRHLFGRGSAFYLSRPSTSAQPKIDPGFGVRATTGVRFRLFAGDLGVELEGGVEGVGARESEVGFGRVLPGYATSTAGPARTTSLSGNMRAQGALSTFPRTADVGAMVLRRSSTSRSPTSPA